MRCDATTMARMNTPLLDQLDALITRMRADIASLESTLDGSDQES
jgi:hypothetical protein